MLQLFFAGEIRASRIRPPGPAMFPEFSELVPSDILHNQEIFTAKLIPVWYSADCC